jgi:ribonuclease Z
LVHEATYEHARAALAHERGHSSGVEAARIAAEAGARTLLLTHFSPSVDGEFVADEARAIHPETIAAKDSMVVEVAGAAADADPPEMSTPKSPT